MWSVGVYVLDFGLVGRQAMEDGKGGPFLGGFCLTTAQVLYSKVAIGLVRVERRPL